MKAQIQAKNVYWNATQWTSFLSCCNDDDSFSTWYVDINYLFTNHCNQWLLSACEKCYDTGRCSGTLLSTDITNTDCECQASCASNQACTDFTFDSTNGICSLMGSCTSLSSCSTCSSGPAVCPTNSPPGMLRWHKEIIDLSLAIIIGFSLR